MSFLVDAYRLLFCKTIVFIEGDIGVEETLDRIRAVLAPGFLSKHLHHSVKGRVDGNRFKLMYGHHIYVPGHVGSREYAFKDAWKELPISPHLYGEIEEDGGLARMRGYTMMSGFDSFNALILFLLIFTSGLAVAFITIYPDVAPDYPQSSVVFLGIFFPLIMLWSLVHTIKRRSKRLVEMLEWLMTTQLE